MGIRRGASKRVEGNFALNLLFALSSNIGYDKAFWIFFEECMASGMSIKDQMSKANTVRIVLT